MDINSIEPQFKAINERLDIIERDIQVVKSKEKFLTDLIDELNNRVLCLENGLNYEECKRQAQDESDEQYRKLYEKTLKEVEEKYPDPQARPLVTELAPGSDPDVHEVIQKMIENKKSAEDSGLQDQVDNS